MKRLIIISILSIPFLAYAQVKGNKQIVTKSFNTEKITNIDVGLYADVLIDMDDEPFLSISVDENLIEKINLAVENGKLTLTQKEWIQPSAKIKIRIGAPYLNQVQQSVHETTRVLNIKGEELRVMAILGIIELNGKVETLYAAGEIGIVDAANLEVTIADINLWDRGSVKLKAPEKITGIVEKDGKVIYSGPKAQVNVKGQGEVISLAEGGRVKNPEARFIKFEIKNNSLNRINCYVKGPKPDGSSFSYGFPLNPGQKREKDWSIGSKVYRVTGLGTHKLLKEITAEDEGQIVKLYDRED